MGADVFFSQQQGKNAKEAFKAARARAQYDHGHAGYSGTIAEKHSFTIITVPGIAGLPTVDTARMYANDLIEKDDVRVDDKWGPAGCIEVQPAVGVKERLFLFFGWASA